MAHVSRTQLSNPSFPATIIWLKGVVNLKKHNLLSASSSDKTFNSSCDTCRISISLSYTANIRFFCFFSVSLLHDADTVPNLKGVKEMNFKIFNSERLSTLKQCYKWSPYIFAPVQKIKIAFTKF